MKKKKWLMIVYINYPKNISLYKYLKVPKISIIIKNGSYFKIFKYIIS